MRSAPRTIVLVAGLSLLLAGTGHAATLKVSGTFPTTQAYGTCTAPIVIPADSGQTSPRAHTRWRGNATGEDSVLTTLGGAWSLSKSVPSGAYTIVAWGSWVTPEGVWTAGCSDSIVKVVGGAPNKVIFGWRAAPNPDFRALLVLPPGAPVIGLAP